MKAILFPGQGVQRRGMGEGLFGLFREYADLASEVLGYSIEDLCLNDPEEKLGQTRYTQPALYVVNALNYYHGRRKGDFQADYFMGHSLGEYNALLAAGAFDFVTGLKLVKKRGELMGAASGGGMAAVLGLKAAQIEKILGSGGFHDIELANYNTPTQLVISGPAESIGRAVKILERENARCIQLNVSGAFHSRYMKDAQNEFREFIETFSFRRPEIPVIANSTARPYQGDDIARILYEQIASPVLWMDSVRYLMGRGVTDYVEVGGAIFMKMVNETLRSEQPLILEDDSLVRPGTTNGTTANGESLYRAEQADAGGILEHERGQDPGENFDQIEKVAGKIAAWMLGSEDFRHDYGVRLSYVAGSMHAGIASKELVTKMGAAGLMSYFGADRLSLEQIEEAIRHFQSRLNRNEPYGMNLSHRPDNPVQEMDTVALYLKHGIRFIEASGYLQITDPVVLYRLRGLRREKDGRIACENHVLAKVSRLEIAEAFMSPAPERIVSRLLQAGEITAEQAEMGRQVPVSHDICVQADSGGYTEGGIASVLMPAMIALKDRMMKQYAYRKSIRVGLAGGIGAPEAAASAFIMGADFILTGSINQCTVESGISESAKDMLQVIAVHDTDYAPADDRFATGARVQVLKKGVFFPARARKLQQLYDRYPSLEALPREIISQVENKYLKRSTDEVWRETVSALAGKGRQADIERADRDPKHKMMLVFGWYFDYSFKAALEGRQEHRLDYQIHTGPALGAFNQWVKGTELENWRRRRVDEIAERLMAETAAVINGGLSRFFAKPGLQARGAVRETAAL
jgi:trans-AT polyketide synthase, acyltransferase and oxidoreductase domains